MIHGRGGRFCAVGCLLLSSVLVTSAALAAGERQATTSPVGTAVRAVAAESAGSIVAAGSDGTSMLVQRIEANGAKGSAFAATPGVARGVAVQPDGKVVVAGADGGMVIRRFNADGTLDTGFGNGGTTRLAADDGTGVAIGPCGTIVAVGSASGSDGSPRPVVARVEADGALDTTLDGDGVALVDFARNSRGKGVAVQADGKILIAGDSAPGGQVTSAFIARVNPDGALDASFNGGRYEYPYGGANASFNAVAIDSAGRIVGAGANRKDTGSFAIFVRLTSDGQADSSFGDNGSLSPTASSSYGGSDPVGASAIAAAGNGELVGAGAFADSNLRTPALWAITSSGRLDDGVGSGGRVTASVGSDGGQSRGVTVTPDGTVVAGGDTVAFSGPTAGFTLRYAGFGTAPAANVPPCGGPPPPSPTITIDRPPLPPPRALSAVRLRPTRIKPKTRAKLRFTLPRAASVSIQVEALRKGRITKGRCASTHRAGTACLYYARLDGRRRIHAHAGVNTITLTSKWSGRALGRGRYRVVLRLSGGSPVQIDFTVHSR